MPASARQHGLNAALKESTRRHASVPNPRRGYYEASRSSSSTDFSVARATASRNASGLVRSGGLGSGTSFGDTDSGNLLESAVTQQLHVLAVRWLVAGLICISIYSRDHSRLPQGSCLIELLGPLGCEEALTLTEVRRCLEGQDAAVPKDPWPGGGHGLWL